MGNKRVLIVGGGVTGLSTALELAALGLDVDIAETSPFPGGHAIQFACKATDECVKCGACVVEEKLREVLAHPSIRLLSATEADTAAWPGGDVVLNHAPTRIDPAACTNCGKCLAACPEGAVRSGCSSHHHPFFTIAEAQCRRENPGCTACVDACPEGAIDLEQTAQADTCRPDAVVAAVGFQPYDPSDKSYGYGMFADVLTNLELERVLRREGIPKRPSDGTVPRHMAFIQCVGSRDAKRGHLWCSKICCGSALRTAQMIRHRSPETQITVFYIDIQNAGKDFNRLYAACRRDIRFVRAIPGDIFETDDHRLQVVYAEADTHESMEDTFDMVVLSIGLTPCSKAADTLQTLGLAPGHDGFFQPEPEGTKTGVFVAGAAAGPMSILESVADAGRVARDVARFLDVLSPKPEIDTHTAG